MDICKLICQSGRNGESIPNVVDNHLWHIDQTCGNGINIVLFPDRISILDEYVFIKNNIIDDVRIPRYKRKTYDLCEKIFDHYHLDPPEIPNNTEEKENDINNFIDYILTTDVMKYTKELIEKKLGEITNEQFKEIIYNKWFIPFDKSSGFQHVFVGEGTNYLAGYHFWYKYWKDTIYDNNYTLSIFFNEKTPEFSLIHFIYYKNEFNPMKRKGGFFIGCSPEFIIATGLLLSYKIIDEYTKINNGVYKIKLYEYENRIKTVYPIVPNEKYNFEHDDYSHDIHDVFISGLLVNYGLCKKKDIIIFQSSSDIDIYIKKCYIQLEIDDEDHNILINSLYLPPLSTLHYHIDSIQLPQKTTLKLLDKKKKIIQSFTYNKNDIDDYGNISFF